MKLYSMKQIISFNLVHPIYNHPVPDSVSGTTEQFGPPAPDSGTESHFIKLVLEATELCILLLMKEGR